MERIELLAPVGSYDAFLAAVQNGADAVYLGGRSFGARAAATFSNDELLEMIRYAHIRDVRVYVTVNTVVMEDEILELLPFLSFLNEAQCDGIIVQDLGVLSLVLNRFPDLTVIASTQMNIHNSAGAQFLKGLGVHRVVLAREVSLEEIKKIRSEVEIEVEVFAHGALCMSYSGECLMSSMLGNRSGNRGRCAQPCRMAYQLEKEGESLGTEAYLLSTKDLMTLPHLADLIRSGVHSLKIEGRLKSSEYVALTTALYRKAIDQFYETGTCEMNETDYTELKQIFNRDFSKGYLLGEHDADLSNSFRPNHMGVLVGVVTYSMNGRLIIRMKQKVRQGDGLRVIAPTDLGLSLNRMWSHGRMVNAIEAGEEMELQCDTNVPVGSEVVRTLDVDQMKRMQKTYEKDYRKVMIHGEFSASVGTPMVLTLWDNDGHHVCVNSLQMVEEAHTTPTSASRVREQLEKLGSTPYRFETLGIIMSDHLMIPIQTLNELRRQGVDEITSKRLERPTRRVLTPSDVLDITTEQKDEFNVKVRSFEQLEGLNSLAIDHLFYEDEETISEAKKQYPNLPIELSTPRIVGTYDNFSTTNSTYGGELGSIQLLNQTTLFSGPYWNVTNSYAIHLLHQSGVSRVGLSLELDRLSIQTIISNYKSHYGTSPRVMVQVYGYPELMITKYCPIAKAQGIRSKHCTLCHHFSYHLNDASGHHFPLKGNADCKMVIYHYEPLSLLPYLSELRQYGVRSFLITFGIETPETVKKVAQAFRNEYDGLGEDPKPHLGQGGHYTSRVL